MINTSEELRKYVPVDINLDPDNLKPAFKRAESELRDIIGDETYDQAKDHYAGENYIPGNYSDADYGKLNQLVDLIQAPFANFAMQKHFIWLMLRVGNNSVTTINGDNERTINKAQMIEAKETLLETAWEFSNDLIDYLNNEKSTFTDWANSEQYTETSNLVFDSFRDFSTNYFTDNSAVYYIHARTTIRRILEDEIKNRVGGSIEKMLTPDVGDPDAKLIKKVKLALAWRTVAETCRFFAIDRLPPTVRQTIDKEQYYSKEDAQTVREKIAGAINEKADRYMEAIDIYRESTITSDANETVMPENYNDLNDEDNNYVIT